MFCTSAVISSSTGVYSFMNVLNERMQISPINHCREGKWVNRWSYMRSKTSCPKTLFLICQVRRTALSLCFIFNSRVSFSVFYSVRQTMPDNSDKNWKGRMVQKWESGQWATHFSQIQRAVPKVNLLGCFTGKGKPFKLQTA